MKKQFRLLLFFGIILTLSSCGVNSYVMFRDSDVKVETGEIPIAPTESYRLARDDKFTMLVYVENGARIIDLGAGIRIDETGSGGSRMQTGNQVEYWVRNSGEVELPVLGLVEVAGLTVIEAQEKLKELYSQSYVDPFIQIEVTNRRVIVFPGSGGSAKVVGISNDNTTLMEVLALAGGITERGKAKKIKLMRNTEEGRKLYQLDLSTIDGLKYADMIVQANDYIYVEPTKQLSREFLKEIAPILSLVTSAMLVFTLVMSFK